MSSEPFETESVTVSGMPPQIVAILRARAQANNRSLAGEIRTILQAWVTREEGV